MKTTINVGQNMSSRLPFVWFDALFQQLSDMIIINGEGGELMRNTYRRDFQPCLRLGSGAVA